MPTFFKFDSVERVEQEVVHATALDSPWVTIPIGISPLRKREIAQTENLRKARVVKPEIVPTKQKEPEPELEEVLDPIDYLIDLILGLELEKDLEKVILAKFHDPKVRFTF